MITTGIIRRINVDSDEKHRGNLYAVELSIFKTPANKNDDSYVVNCTCCTMPGVYNSYKVNDAVYIGFINNQFNSPVILGKIYKGVEDNSDARSYQLLSSLELRDNIELAESATINGTNVGFLSQLISNLKLTLDDLQNSQRYLHELYFKKIENNQTILTIAFDIKTLTETKIETKGQIYPALQSDNVVRFANPSFIPFYPANGLFVDADEADPNKKVYSVSGFSLKLEDRYFTLELNNGWTEVNLVNITSWAKEISYTKYDIVKRTIDNNILTYICKADHVSTETFDTTKWEEFIIEDIELFDSTKTYQEFDFISTEATIKLFGENASGQNKVVDLPPDTLFDYTFNKKPRIVF